MWRTGSVHEENAEGAEENVRSQPTPKDLSPRGESVKGGAGNLGMKQKGWNPGRQPGCDANARTKRIDVRPQCSVYATRPRPVRALPQPVSAVAELRVCRLTPARPPMT